LKSSQLKNRIEIWTVFEELKKVKINLVD
jgi:hypothetical protein